MAKMLVTDRDSQVHEVEGQPGLKFMETLREFDYGVTAICGGLCPACRRRRATRRNCWSSSSTTIRPGRA
jgi:hypothetical protein